MPKPVIGISSCLLGHEVRHDGGHKQSGLVTRELSRFFDMRPYCPEVASGLGIPRPALRLNRLQGEIRIQESHDASVDVTPAIEHSAETACQSFADLSGYIVKKDSPSCGMERVRIYSKSGIPERNGQGVFTRILMQTFPCLPVEEEGRLNDAALRESFIERVFVYGRWQQLQREGLTLAKLMQFHARHKFSLLSRDESVYRAMGPLVAGAYQDNLECIAEQYIERLMQALKKPASRKRHSNVLMHLLGYFKEVLSRDEKREMLEILDQYRAGVVPLVVPLTLLQHHLRRAPDPYLEQQTYFDPYPRELGLRNDI